MAIVTLHSGRRYDIIIRNGRVLDGTGNPWYSADIAFRRGTIVAVGDLSEDRGREEINATGLTVTPGFIDTHSHAGPGLASAELSHARPLLAQGITTVFVNPDGGGAFNNLIKQKEELLKHNLGVNVAQFISHGTIRREVIGMDNKKPTLLEQQKMRELVKTAMEAGSWGLSSGTFYAPGSYSQPDEIVDLATVVAEYDGVYQSHIRDEANYTIGVVAAVEEVIDVARRANLPVVVTHIKALGPSVWGKSKEIVKLMNEAREEGLEVYADQYPYTASATGLSAALLPRWVQAGGKDSLLIRLQDPVNREKIKIEMEKNLARRGGADRIQFRRVEFNESLEGKKLDKVADEFEMNPIDASVKLMMQGNTGIISFNMNDMDVHTFMGQNWTMTASDGGLVPWMQGVPHPRSYGAFSQKIEKYVIEENVIGLSYAIKSMTFLPATVYRMVDRGIIREGAVADVIVFDPAKIRNMATYTKPHQLAEGMTHVFVNGESAIRNGAFTGALAGVVLHKR